MHRVLANDDCCLFHNEAHLPAAGCSIGVPMAVTLVNPGATPGCTKINESIQIGPMSVKPMGMGHDGGIGRPHVLVSPGPDPATIAAASAIASALATATSSAKPPFTAHKNQIGVGSDSLPVCIDPTPISLGVLSVMFCGTPDVPNTVPLLPTHLNVYSGMTAGDLLGGFANIIADFVWSGVTAGLGRTTNRAARFVDRIAGIIFMNGGPLRSVASRNAAVRESFKAGPSNPGTFVQQQWDDDGVEHDGDPGLGLGLFGNVEYDQDTNQFRYSHPPASAAWRWLNDEPDPNRPLVEDMDDGRANRLWR